MPSSASSGTSTATWSGSNTTISPNVRGSTNHSSRRSSSVRATCVCAGRGAPPAASSTWPLIRRWIITESPESSGSSRYLPRRSRREHDRVGQPVDQRLARRPAHDPLTADLHPHDPPTDDVLARGPAVPSRPRAAQACGGVPVSVEHGAGSWTPRAVRRPSSNARSPARAARRRRTPRRRTSWHGRAPSRRTCRRERRARRVRHVPAAASCCPAGRVPRSCRGTPGRRAVSTMSYAASVPPSRYTAPSTASNASDRIDGFSRPLGGGLTAPEADVVAETDLASHVGERQRVDHALAKVGELALGRVPESSVGRCRRPPNPARHRRGTPSARCSSNPDVRRHHERWFSA